MKAGDYVLDQKIVFDRNNNPTVVGSAHLVENSLSKTLKEIAVDHKKKRVALTIAQHEDTYGWRLSKEELEQRADLILRYKNVGPIWIWKDHKWLKFKRCLDFKCPDMHIRCVDNKDDLHIFNPDEVTIATQDERTRHIAIIRQKQLRKDIESLRVTGIDLRKRASSIEQRAGALEEEVDRIERLLKRSNAEEQRRKRHRRRKYEQFVRQT